MQKQNLRQWSEKISSLCEPKENHRQRSKRMDGGGRERSSPSSKPSKFSVYQNPALSAVLTANSRQPSKSTFLSIFFFSTASAFAFLGIISWYSLAVYTAFEMLILQYGLFLQRDLSLRVRVVSESRFLETRVCKILAWH